MKSGNAPIQAPAGGADDPPPPSTASVPYRPSPAPDPGARSFQGADDWPGQLLGSIGAFTVPADDGTGYEVRHADSGRRIAWGSSADEAQERAQDLVRWLGRRRLAGWLQSDAAAPPSQPPAQAAVWGDISQDTQGAPTAAKPLSDIIQAYGVQSPKPQAGKSVFSTKDASDDYHFLKEQKGWSDAQAAFAVTPYDEAAADMSPSVVNLGPDAVHDYLHLRHQLGWSDADASKAVGADRPYAFPYHSKIVEPYKSDFVSKIYPAAWKNQQDTGIPAAVTTAQAILESGFGSRVPVDIDNQAPSYNLFGVKAGPDDDYVSANTHEVLNGQRQSVLADFAAYGDYQGSIDAHSAFLQNNPRYSKLFDRADPVAWAHGLQAAGYSTDPNYANSLIGVMKSWHLIPEK